jgi:hypothetical protein
LVWLQPTHLRRLRARRPAGRARGAGVDTGDGELAFERSGPERFLSTMPLLIERMREVGAEWSAEAECAIFRLFAHLVVLRRLSRAVSACV